MLICVLLFLGYFILNVETLQIFPDWKVGAPSRNVQYITSESISYRSASTVRGKFGRTWIVFL